jgi:hypothetical protein
VGCYKSSRTVYSLNELAESIHSGNLKMALEQLNNTGKVLPRLSAASDGKVYDFSIIGMKLETALEILKFQIKPDVVNLMAMIWVRTQTLDNEFERTDSKRCLLVMTLDCLGDRIVSLLETCKEADIVKTKSVDFGNKVQDLTLHTNDDNEFELCFKQESIDDRRRKREEKHAGLAA